METSEKVWFFYDEMFCDELSIKILYQNKNCINEFVDENENPTVVPELILETDQQRADWMRAEERRKRRTVN